MKINKLIFSLIILSLGSCQLFSVQEESEVLASVNTHQLYKSDLVEAMPNQITKNDSAIFAQTFIEKWATDKILIDRAKLNLPKSQQSYFDSLAKDYRDELLKKAYLNAVVEKQAKTQIDSLEIVNYYEQNKLNFKLNESLLQIRYIVLKQDIQGFKAIKKALIRFDETDRSQLSNQSLEFKSLFLNDSTWVRSIDIEKELKPYIEDFDLELFNRKGFVEKNIKDTFVLIYLKNKLSRNDQAPLSYIKPTIRQILLNKKKLQVSQQIQQELKNDAIQNNEFKIYE
ncbi:hypothetical protein [Psychroflexus sp. ALD_RP9]|uniref:hypothetical protein n=1 Tax=Psychroflexus sp. ALD_RP9 TaxID=2777186 RepID=UPI001A8C435A|nr:hypothetical protein [Psychroflexus sp. ALD_RP9]QSS97580.1 hypothetical protein IMZ30_02390 [Psychroflexus sp. ALD_RP9]